MAKTVPLKTWEDFKKIITRLFETTGESISENRTLLFRGQENSGWDLETTLDRRVSRPFSYMEYLSIAQVIKPEIETFTGHSWTIPGQPELKKYVEEYSNHFMPFPAYEYLIYLRHHGFPSPLLDWSTSPYIAAFFACRHATKENDIAIYCFDEAPNGWKSSGSGTPQIISLGPYSKGHKRHFWQQSQYTICANFRDERWSYEPHENVFKLNDPDQDRLTKYTLPASERHKILKDLDLFNINAFSLFQNEESLLEKLSLRELQ